MIVERIKITNFKCFNGTHEFLLRDDLTILVGDNEVGKSTVLEALHLAFTGQFHGKSVRNNIYAYLFNKKVVEDYIAKCKRHEQVFIQPPEIQIEIWFKNAVNAELFEGDGNSEKAKKREGFSFTIGFNTDEKIDYQELLKKGKEDPIYNLETLPLEYYVVRWQSFRRDTHLTPRTLPLRTVFIDSSDYQYHRGADASIISLISEALGEEEMRRIVNEHRQALTQFNRSTVIKSVNERIGQLLATDYKISVSAETSDLRSWETNVKTHVDEVPFAFGGRGAQCITKTDLAFSKKTGDKPALILLEEPESHLSPSRLNRFMDHLDAVRADHQIIVSTHSSFVANKLGLDKLLLMSRYGLMPLGNLADAGFFRRLPGYDTLRLVLADRIILVEGASDELVVQRAYMDSHDGRLPFIDGIDVISVGIAFSRYVQMLISLNKKASILTDNDGKTDVLLRKYKELLPEATPRQCVNVYFSRMTLGAHQFGVSQECLANYSTLEPYILYNNSYALLNTVFDKDYESNEEMLKYMHGNKVECALKIFESTTSIKYPDYILQAIEHVEQPS